MDRNYRHIKEKCRVRGSLSARRAWIEIPRKTPTQRRPMSLSARRAWIEILSDTPKAQENPVALRKESVDRNMALLDENGVESGRSPQGERG